MKFRQSEYDSIKALIEACDLDYSEFSFVKKRGKLHIHWSKKEDPFVFYRTVGTTIEGGQFVEKTEYLIGPKKEIKRDSWEEVLSEIKIFLTA